MVYTHIGRYHRSAEAIDVTSYITFMKRFLKPNGGVSPGSPRRFGTNDEKMGTPLLANR